MEIWKSLVFNNKYDVSNMGRVRSWNKRGFKLNNPKRTSEPTYLSLSRNNHGYPCVNIVSKNYYVHVLVAEHFIGSKPEGMEVCHKNGIRADNRLENLRWDTSESNSEDMMVHQTRQFGEDVPSSKLTANQVNKIRELYATGKYYQKDLASMYGVCQQQVSMIVRHKHWTVIS